jgi:periplasmic divalent cation tolerance protein
MHDLPVNEDDPLALLYVPCGSEAEALGLGRALVDAGLIACANLHPIRSIYRWEGRVVDEAEVVLLAKTPASQVAAAEAEIQRRHTYSTPCILRLPTAGVNPDYLAWAQAAVRGAPGDAGAGRGL